MLHNYIITTIRGFLRQPIYSIINISGLVLGLSCCIFIFLWVAEELDYDRYHPDNVRVFKVMQNELQEDGSISTDQWIPREITEVIKAEFPEVDGIAGRAWSEDKLFKFGEKINYEAGAYADPSIFEVLNMKLVEGSLSKALPDNNSVAISRTMAKRFFNESKALGQIFRINNTMEATVTAVYEDLPWNASEYFDFVLPAEVYIKEGGGYLNAFVKLKEAGMRPAVEAKLRNLWKSRLPEQRADPGAILFPMTDWRLYSHFENGKQTGGRISYVISFTLVGFFILGIACVNFMNLSTARAANRSREVGIRKVAGASRQSLFRQFMTESIAMSIVAMIVALLIVQLMLPMFNSLTQKRVFLNFNDPVIFAGVLGITLFTGVLAGSYPAVFLSSFRPASVLKGNLQSVFAGAGLRRALVVFQFGLSVIIIICALVINNQIAYMRNKNLGFDRSNVITIKTNSEVLSKYQAFRIEALRNPTVTSVGLGAANPMEINGGAGYDWDGHLGEEAIFNQASCDFDYLHTLGFTFVEGRNFSKEFPSDTGNFVVTQEVVKRMGLEHAVGMKLRQNGVQGEIIGVIKDFHNLDIHEAWNPTVLSLAKTDEEYGRWAEIFVRYDPGRLTEALDHIQKVYKDINPEFPIQYGFLDQSFERQFRTESTVATLSLWFTVLAIVISCLGLFGLALFNTERRFKEIGIRKVLGASVSGLVVLLCRDFVKLVVYAIVLGSPLAFYVMEWFLEGYPYRTPLSFSMFAIPALGLLVISLSIISWQSVKAALGNPVEALRSE